MNYDFYKQLIDESPAGYAYHKIIYNEEDIVCDYEFIEVNYAFEILTGLQATDIVGKKITEVPSIVREYGFDAIELFGDIGINGGSKEFEYYSKLSKRWLRVAVSSFQKNYVVTRVIDITKEVLNLSAMESMVKLSEELLQLTDQEIDYQKITDDFLKITDAKYAIFDLFEEDERSFTTMAIAGDKAAIKEANEILGCIIKGNKWAYDPIRALKCKDSTITRFTSLQQLVDGVIPQPRVTFLEKEHHLGEVIVIKIERNNKIIGAFILIMEMGARFDKDILAKLYSKQLGMVFTRKRAEDILHQERIFIEALLESVPGFLYVYDDSDRLIRWNKKLEDMTGYMAEELPYMTLNKWFDEEEFIRAAAAVQKVLETGYGELETQVITKGGEKLPIQVNGVRLTFNGKTYFTGIGMDISQRKRNEEKLREIETKQTAMISNISDVITIVDEKGINQYKSPNIERIFGWSPDERIGKSYLETVHIEDRERLQAEFKELIKNDNRTIINTECRYKNKNGSYSIVEISAMNLLAHPEIKGVLATYYDITARKLVEEALKESEEQFALAIEGTETGLWDWDMVHDRITYSAPCLQMLGYEKHEIIETFSGFAKLCHPDDKALIGKAMDDYITGKVKHCEVTYRLRHKDGSWRWFVNRGGILKDREGKPYRWVGTIIDITTQKNIEDELKKSEESYKFLFEFSGVAIGYCKPDGTVISYNKKAAKYIKGIPKDLVGKSVYELFPKKRAEIYMERIKKAVTSKKTQEYEDHIVFNNNPRWLLSTYNRIMDLNGKIAGIQIISQDITDRKNSEQELIKAKEAAEGANAAKSQFLANMSHEIRTPMNGFMGMMQLLELTQLTEEQQELIKISKTTSDLLLSVINDILDYSKIEAGMMELEKVPLNIKTLLGDAVGLFEVSAIQKGIIIESFIERGVPDNVIGDPFRIRQILSNLIGNAVKYTQKGQIDVIVKKIGDFNDGNLKLEFIVRDTGIGIAADKIPLLFKSFSQVDNSNTRNYGGTGLGLVIAKRLAEKMEGDIGVQSKKGEGSSFFFSCMLEKADVEKEYIPLSVKTQVEDQQNKELRVLLVEDDAVSRMVVKRMAKGRNWNFEVAENGQEAVDIIQQRSFDIILMDVQMPCMDGYEATRIIRSMETLSNRHIPIIAMTAYALKGDRERCLEAGMDDYLSKPVNVQEFSAMIERWVPMR